MKVWLGWDAREEAAYEIACRTSASFGCDVSPIYEQRLRDVGLLTRPVDRRGSMFDLNSSAHQSTEFAISRFFVPLLEHAGWCLFADSDVVFIRDPHELLDLVDPSKAVMVVKHQGLTETGWKMDGQRQLPYERKNWSSVCLWNCDHPGNKRLNLITLNQWPGRDLHAFGWLADSEIGEIPSEWNWLVGIQPKPVAPAIAHFTNGGPWLPSWKGAEHDDIWLNA